MLARGDDVRLGAGLVSGGRGGAAGNDQNYHKVFIRTIYNGKKDVATFILSDGS